jgi:DNA-directed RNA polymerase beta' subunit
VPELVARDMTYPERVTASNIGRMRQLVLNGPGVHPGANYVRRPAGFTLVLKFVNRANVARDLRIGDVVERHLADGDPVLFNRQVRGQWGVFGLRVCAWGGAGLATRLLHNSSSA